MSLKNFIHSAAAITVMTFVTPALAQTAGEPARAIPPQAWGFFGENEDQLVSIDYPGGTALDYINKVRQAFAPFGKLNIVAFPGVEKFTVPPVQLTGISPLGAVAMLDGMTITDENGLRTMLHVRGEDMVIVIRTEEADLGRPLETSVWSLEPAIRRGMKSMDILAAVEAALAVFEKPALVKFHQETSLLIARGTGDQLSAIENVLEGVERTAAYRNEQLVSAEDLEAAKHEVERMKIELQRQQSRVAAAEREVQEAKSVMNPKDPDDAAELRNLELEAETARLDMHEAVMELDAATRRYERLEALANSEK